MPRGLLPSRYRLSAARPLRRPSAPPRWSANQFCLSGDHADLRVPLGLEPSPVSLSPGSPDAWRHTQRPSHLAVQLMSQRTNRLQSHPQRVLEQEEPAKSSSTTPPRSASYPPPRASAQTAWLAWNV